MYMLKVKSDFGFLKDRKEHTIANTDAWGYCRSLQLLMLNKLSTVFGLSTLLAA